MCSNFGYYVHRNQDKLVMIMPISRAKHTQHRPLLLLDSAHFLEAEGQLVLVRRVVSGHLHVEGRARVAEILGGENGTLLADEQSGRVPVKGLIRLSPKCISG